jgi:hypothetical protein
MPLCSSHLPLGVPNWAASTANTGLHASRGWPCVATPHQHPYWSRVSVRRREVPLPPPPPHTHTHPRHHPSPWPPARVPQAKEQVTLPFSLRSRLIWCVDSTKPNCSSLGFNMLASHALGKSLISMLPVLLGRSTQVLSGRATPTDA